MPSAHGVSRPIAFSPSDKVDRAYDPSWADSDPLYIPRIFFMSSRDISRCGVSRPPSLPEEAPRLLPYGGPWLGLSRELVGSFADAPECEAKAGLTRWMSGTRAARLVLEAVSGAYTGGGHCVYSVMCL